MYHAIEIQLPHLKNSVFYVMEAAHQYLKFLRLSHPKNCPVIFIRLLFQGLIWPSSADRCSQQARQTAGARSWKFELENDTQTHHTQADCGYQNH